MHAGDADGIERAKERARALDLLRVVGAATDRTDR
jgi:hypothetical protein